MYSQRVNCIHGITRELSIALTAPHAQAQILPLPHKGPQGRLDRCVGPELEGAVCGSEIGSDLCRGCLEPSPPSPSWTPNPWLRPSLPMCHCGLVSEHRRGPQGRLDRCVALHECTIGGHPRLQAPIRANGSATLYNVFPLCTYMFSLCICFPSVYIFPMYIYVFPMYIYVFPM